MQLTIFDLLKDTRFPLQVDENVTLQELKSRIHENGGIPGAFQKLLFCGTQLQPGNLQEQGIENRSILFLVSVGTPPFDNFTVTVGFLGGIHQIEVQWQQRVRDIQQMLAERTGVFPNHILRDETGELLIPDSSISELDLLSGTLLQAFGDDGKNEEGNWTLSVQGTVEKAISLLNVQKTSTIMDLRQSIQWNGVQIFGSKFGLYFKGRPLENHRTLSSYNMEDGSHIIIIPNGELKVYERMQLCIRNRYGRREFLTSVAPDCTPIWLFQEMRKVLDYPVDDLQILYEGRELTGKDLLTPFSELGIHHGSILEYISSAENGPISEPGRPHPSSSSEIFWSPSNEMQVNRGGITFDHRSPATASSVTFGHDDMDEFSFTFPVLQPLRPPFNDDQGAHAACAGEIKELRSQLQFESEAKEDLQKALTEKNEECEKLKNADRSWTKLLKTVEAKVKNLEEGLKDEKYLLERSPIIRKLHFHTLVSTKYDQILESGSFGDLQTFDQALQIHIPDDRKTNARTFTRSERYYVSALNTFKRKIITWISNTTASTETSFELPFQAALQVLRQLCRTGSEMVSFVERHDPVSMFNSRRSVKNLYVHVVMLSIYENVFSPFIFGVDASFSAKLSALQNSILTQETDFAKVLNVYQRLGLAATNYVANSIPLVEQKRVLAANLTRLFSQFLPPENCKQEVIFGIVDEAAELKNEMAKESALYSFYWYSPEAKVNLESDFYEFDGWSDQGPLHLCLCPGISESIKLEDGALREICISPAQIEL